MAGKSSPSLTTTVTKPEDISATADEERREGRGRDNVGRVKDGMDSEVEVGGSGGG